MEKEVQQSLQLVATNFIPYAMPVTVGAGILGHYADHTFVIGTSGQNIYNCTCYGDIVVPGPGNWPVQMLMPGNMAEVSAMINLSTVLKPNYDSLLTDHCGIIYGLEGVCHQMTNRILFTAARQVMNPFTAHVKCITLTFILYGFFGQTVMPFQLRLFSAYLLSQMSGLGQENDRKAAPTQEVFDFHQYGIFHKTLDTNGYQGNEPDYIHDLIHMELEGISTPATRLSAVYQHTILANNPNKIKNDPKVQLLLKELEVFEKIFENARKLLPISGQPDIKTLNAIAQTINQAFQKLNTAMYSILGKDYCTMFHEEFDPDLCPCELM